MKGVFIIKIIYNKDKDLRIKEDTLENSLDNLHFYIPKNLHGNFYCRIVDSNKNESILKLSKFNSEDKIYNIYKVSLDNYVICESGNVFISLLIIEESIPHITKAIQLDLSFDNYKSLSQLYMADNLTSEVINKYKKIVELTQMNINIYKDILEVKEK